MRGNLKWNMTNSETLVISPKQSKGKEHKITGNFTFFAQDVSQNIGALQHISQTNNNPCVFIVLIGSFTQRQLTYHTDRKSLEKEITETTLKNPKEVLLKTFNK